MPLIQTEFDDLLENDIILEETDKTPDYAALLKNAENMLKSYLYIKKIADASSPFVNSIVKVSTIDTTLEKEEYVLNGETGKILLKNIHSADNCSIFFNGGEFVLFPYETIELPVKDNTTIETKGKLSIIESEYKLGKG